MELKKKYVWAKQSIVSNLEIIDCLVYDPIKDYRGDPSGFYLLIRIDSVNSLIEVAICNQQHVIIKAFRGKKSQDLYHTIFEYEKKHNCEWFKSKEHSAYLGKELKKAEYALVKKEVYIQE